MAELSALFPDKRMDTIGAILADSGGDKSVAASRPIQWSSGTCKLPTQVYYLNVINGRSLNLTCL